MTDVVIVGEPRQVIGEMLAREVVVRNPQSQTMTTIPRRDRVVSANDRQQLSIGQIGPRGPAGAGAAGVPPIAFAFGDAPHAIWTAPANGILSYVRVAVETPFNGAGASMQIGTAVNDGSAMPAAFIGLATVADYEHTPDLPLTAGQSVYVTISPGSGATAGNGVIFLQFLEN